MVGCRLKTKSLQSIYLSSYYLTRNRITGILLNCPRNTVPGNRSRVEGFGEGFVVRHDYSRNDQNASVIAAEVAPEGVNEPILEPIQLVSLSCYSDPAVPVLRCVLVGEPGKNTQHKSDVLNLCSKSSRTTELSRSNGISRTPARS